MVEYAIALLKRWTPPYFMRLELLELDAGGRVRGPRVLAGRAPGSRDRAPMLHVSLSCYSYMLCPRPKPCHAKVLHPRCLTPPARPDPAQACTGGTWAARARSWPCTCCSPCVSCASEVTLSLVCQRALRRHEATRSILVGRGGMQSSRPWGPSRALPFAAHAMRALTWPALCPTVLPRRPVRFPVPCAALPRCGVPIRHREFISKMFYGNTS